MKTKKPIIIAIVGGSGSGKTSLSSYLNEYHDIPAICSYTTRPMREGEVNGKDHWFTGTCVLTPSSELAYTQFAGHSYWAYVSQVEECKVCTYVIDEKGLLSLNSKWKDRFDIVSVYVNRPDISNIDCERLERDIYRITLSPAYYNIMLDNNSDLETFLNNSADIILSYISENYDCEDEK